jgi:micrococcal nuclease
LIYNTLNKLDKLDKYIFLINITKMSRFLKIPNLLSIFNINDKYVELPDNSMNKNCLIDGTDIEWKDTLEFIFPIQGGRVIKVYDGDTITIASRLPYEGSPLYRFSVRLNGIDAPEIKSKNEEEKMVAIECRDKLSALILNKYISLKNIQNEKYGRILATIYLNGLCINDLLIKERYVVKYDGKEKKIPVSWLKYRLTGELN